MATATTAIHQKLGKSPGKIGMMGFGVVLLVGIIYSAFHLLTDLSTVHSGSLLPYALLGIALLVALGFEFVNGFHDTANAVATVIYTHSLEPHIAVVWSGLWNFLGTRRNRKPNFHRLDLIRLGVHFNDIIVHGQIGNRPLHEIGL